MFLFFWKHVECPRQKHDFHIQKISSFPPFHTHFRRNLLRNAKKLKIFFIFLFFRFVGQILRKKGQTRNRIAATFFRLSALKLKNRRFFALDLLQNGTEKTNIMFFSSLSLSKIRVFVTFLYKYKVFFSQISYSNLGSNSNARKNKKINYGMFRIRWIWMSYVMFPFFVNFF